MDNECLQWENNQVKLHSAGQCDKLSKSPDV